MSSTLASITKLLAEIITDVTTGTATGGSTTTLVDTARTEVDDYWNNGCIWITSGTYSGNSRSVSDITASSDTVTWTTAFAGNIVAGVTYAICPGLPEGFSQSVLRNSINAALAQVYLPAYNVATTTVANQMSYTLPSGVDRIRRVEIATSTSSPYGYVPHYHW